MQRINAQFDGLWDDAHSVTVLMLMLVRAGEDVAVKVVW